MKQVLVYINDSINTTYLYEILEKYEFVYRVVEDRHLEEEVQGLFSETNIKGSTSSIFDFPFILFNNIEMEEIFAFLKDFNFKHKAVLTKHNKTWKLKALLEEIKEEEIYYTSFKKLKTLIAQANTIDFSSYKEEITAPYKESILTAYMYLKKEKPDLETIDILIKRIEDTKKRLYK